LISHDDLQINEVVNYPKFIKLSILKLGQVLFSTVKLASIADPGLGRVSYQQKLPEIRGF